MPEGDTILRAARTLRHAMAGRTVRAFETVLPHLQRVHEDEAIIGRTIEDVQAAGKHLVIALSGGLVLRSHLRMHGRWHLYRRGEAWRRARASMRVLLATDEYVAVGFDLVDVAFHAARTLRRDTVVASLGPDLLSDSFDEDEAVRRLRREPDELIAVALLDQRRLAGMGNVYKSETLFLGRVNPFAPVSALPDDTIRALVRQARRLMQANVRPSSGDQIVTYRGFRRTTGRTNPDERLWVYRRRGRPCRRCGTAIDARKVGLAARTTYFCPRCQQVR
jgi:endonuclease-8